MGDAKSTTQDASKYYMDYWPNGEIQRTSQDVLIERADFPGLQAAFDKVLNGPRGCPPPLWEKSKVVRYTKGGLFTPHGDIGGEKKRTAALFVYLNDCQEGGE